jgi:hypothetical protein
MTDQPGSAGDFCGVKTTMFGLIVLMKPHHGMMATP